MQKLNVAAFGVLKNKGQINCTQAVLNSGLFENLAEGNMKVAKDAVFINESVFNNVGNLEIEGQLANNANGSTLNNNGTITLIGVFNNNGTFTNNKKLLMLEGVLAEFNNYFVVNNTQDSLMNLGGQFINFEGQINNYGFLFVTYIMDVKEFSFLNNYYEFFNFSIINNYGTLTNAGLFINNGNINNLINGVINNSATIIIYINSVFSNMAFFSNTLTGETSIENDGVLNNHNQFNTDGLVTNNGTFVNFMEGTITNNGTMNNRNMLENKGTLLSVGTYINSTSGETLNSASFTTSGLVDNLVGTFTNDATGTLTVDATGVFQNSAAFTNRNIFNVSGNFSNLDTFLNEASGQVTIFSGGTCENNETFTNEGGLTNNNNGTCANNKNFLLNGLISNAGLFTNNFVCEILGNFQNISQGEVNNFHGIVIKGEGSLTNNYGGNVVNEFLQVNSEIEALCFFTIIESGSLSNLGGTFTNKGFCQNQTLITNSLDGNIINTGNFINENEVYNEGSITSSSFFLNDGILNNFNLLLNTNQFFNYGTIVNNFDIYNYTNNGNFVNSGAILNLGRFNSADGSSTCGTALYSGNEPAPNARGTTCPP